VRIVLIGPEADRDRLRPDLLEAGLQIVAELAARPAADDGLNGADAIVETRHATPALSRRAADQTRDEPLTPREQDVLERMAEGLSNKAIAEALGISDQTVKFHVAAIIGKFGATNRTDAVRRAIRRGLVAV
jgi:DNA-binding NarL/FixJ family response regulator